MWRAGDESGLVAALRDHAESGRDNEIARALASAPDRAAYAAIWRALCAAVEKPPAAESVSTRVFAIPWAIVCGGSASAELPCVLPDVSELARTLEQNGAFGASRNLGFSNALCSIETLEALKPSQVLEWANTVEPKVVPPAPIRITRGLEEVHVRFLVGAAIAPAHAPDVVETGSNISAWGTPALRAMGAQLATSGIQILPMPRPPAGLYTAAYQGRRAGIETAFHLFMSNAVRRIRMAVGDPRIALSSHESGDVPVTLTTILDDTFVEGFRWPLHPADDLDEVQHAITTLAWECRLPEVHVVERVLPDSTSTGAVLFPTPNA